MTDRWNYTLAQVPVGHGKPDCLMCGKPALFMLEYDFNGKITGGVHHQCMYFCQYHAETQSEYHKVKMPEGSNV